MLNSEEGGRQEGIVRVWDKVDRQNSDGSRRDSSGGIDKRLLSKRARWHSMRGLCHGCLTSNTEISVLDGKMLCAECASTDSKQAGNEH